MIGAPLQQGIPGAVSNGLVNLGVPPSVAGPIATAIVFVVTLVVVYVVGKATVIPIVRRMLDRRNVDSHARKPLLRITAGVVAFAAVSVAFGLAEFGNFLQSLATIAAAATLAIGFAMQDVIANFVAGVFIYSDKPFRIGDWIEWDGNSGIVEDISLRVTRVRTFDNELLTVPNSVLTSGVVKNPVAKEELRLKYTFGIGYDDDIDQATEIILAEAEAHEEILDDPEPSVRLTELGDSSVGLTARIWIDDPSRSDFVKTRGQYVQAVKEEFDATGIDIPYPNRTIGGGLTMENLDGAVTPAED